jgi:hypothetical protein
MAVIKTLDWPSRGETGNMQLVVAYLAAEFAKGLDRFFAKMGQVNV